MPSKGLRDCPNGARLSRAAAVRLATLALYSPVKRVEAPVELGFINMAIKAGSSQTTYTVVVVEHVTSSAAANTVTAARALSTLPDTPLVRDTGSGVMVVVVVAVPQVVVV